jgi:hypothetical protein
MQKGYSRAVTGAEQSDMKTAKVAEAARALLHRILLILILILILSEQRSAFARPQSGPLVSRQLTFARMSTAVIQYGE